MGIFARGTKKEKNTRRAALIVVLFIVLLSSVGLFIHYQKTKVYREQYKEYIINQE